MARDRAVMTENLYAFSRKLAGVFTLDDLLWATAFHIAQMLKVRVVILLPEGESIAVRAGYPPEDTLDAADMAAAKWVWDHATPAGRGADTLPGARRLFLPMRTGRGMVGVVGLDKDGSGPILSAEERRLFDALADQASLAIERILLAADVDRARFCGGKRAPARGAAHLHLPRPAHAAGVHPGLGHQPEGPARRAGPGGGDRAARHHPGRGGAAEPLHRQPSRYDAAGIRRAGAAAGIHDIGDVIGSALHRAARVLERHRIAMELAADLPPLRLDPVLFEQVLFNLLDNAAKYAPAGSTVTLRTFTDGSEAVLTVTDEGAGIPPADLERIFDKFYRVQAADRQRAGTGLGLPICRGFIEGMGGTITAGNRAGGHGAVFTIRLPAPREHAA